jgi:hypothetical protein
VSFVAITLCVPSQQVFFVVYFIIDSVRKLLDTPSYMEGANFNCFVICSPVSKTKVFVIFSCMITLNSHLILFFGYVITCSVN